MNLEPSFILELCRSLSHPANRQRGHTREALSFARSIGADYIVHNGPFAKQLGIPYIFQQRQLLGRHRPVVLDHYFMEQVLCDWVAMHEHVKTLTTYVQELEKSNCLNRDRANLLAKALFTLLQASKKALPILEERVDEDNWLRYTITDCEDIHKKLR